MFSRINKLDEKNARLGDTTTRGHVADDTDEREHLHFTLLAAEKIESTTRISIEIEPIKEKFMKNLL